jgi:hypothetical protein
MNAIALSNRDMSAGLRKTFTLQDVYDAILFWILLDCLLRRN